mgnify:CR=1 FL=1
MFEVAGVLLVLALILGAILGYVATAWSRRLGQALRSLTSRHESALARISDLEAGEPTNHALEGPEWPWNRFPETASVPAETVAEVHFEEAETRADRITGFHVFHGGSKNRSIAL